MKKKIGIIGGGGYTAGELLRILLHHPLVELTYVYSNSQAGKPVYSVHEDLVGDTDLAFTDEVHFDVDVLFLCQGHGQAEVFMNNHIVPDQVVVIDLGNDFRLEGKSGFVYGLPELHREQTVGATRIANPGCFATAIQLALLPLAAGGLLQEHVHISAITGSTGAGQAPSATTHFSWRQNNLSVYKAFTHQHMGEIWQSVRQLQPQFPHDIFFVPIRGDFARGIFASIHTTCQESEVELVQRYETYYRDAPFTVVTRENPNMKQVVNTNKCLLFVEKYKDQVHIISAIDNLVKGASGQAVQNMNIALGFPEQTGLQLKAIGF